MVDQESSEAMDELAAEPVPAESEVVEPAAGPSVVTPPAPIMSVPRFIALANATPGNLYNVQSTAESTLRNYRLGAISDLRAAAVMRRLPAIAERLLAVLDRTAPPR